MKAQFLQPLRFATQFVQVGRALVDLLEASLALLKLAESFQQRLEGIAARILEKPAEKIVVVRRARGDFAVGLGGPEEFADIGVLRLAAEEPRADRIGVVVDVSVVLAAGEHGDGALEFGLRRGAETAFFLYGERKLRDGNGRDAAPAFIGNVHSVRGKSDGKRDDTSGIRLQLDRRVCDSRLAHGASGDGVVAKHDSLDGASAGILRARHARGGVELHFASGGQYEVNCVEDGRLARAVVAQKEQMPAVWNLNRRRPEVVELHNPHGGYPV